jgi:GT2 family glycosyltransferase
MLSSQISSIENNLQSNDQLAKNKRDFRLAVVIPTHNRWQEARVTLSRLLDSDYKDLEIILINDGCNDGTVENCAKEFPGVTMLHGDGNLWWSGAINSGVEYALHKGADAIVWMNDDNRVEPQTLTHMIESFKRVGQRSIICARTKSTETGMDEWVGEPPRWHQEFGKWIAPHLGAPDIALEHPPGGRGVLIPAECFREIGLVDQNAFPHYWADHDFHYRAMKAGFKLYLARDAAVWNVPNAGRKDAPDKFSLKWARYFLFNRRSPMNMLTLRRLLKRHLAPAEYRAVYYKLLWRSLKWLASGWTARTPVIARLLRFLKRSFVVDKRSSCV